MYIGLSEDECLGTRVAIGMALQFLGNKPQAGSLKSADKKLERKESDFTREELLCMALATSTGAQMAKDGHYGQDMAQRAYYLESLSSKFKSYL